MIGTNKDDFQVCAQECITKQGKNTVRQENNLAYSEVIVVRTVLLRPFKWATKEKKTPQKRPLNAQVPPGLDRSPTRIRAAPNPGAREAAKLSHVATVAHQHCVIVPCHTPRASR
jgi:hypothetical protein